MKKKLGSGSLHISTIGERTRMWLQGKLFYQNRNSFHLESLIWGSDKAENASQGIYNPLASGGLERSPDPRCNASAPRPEGPAHQRRGGGGKVNCFLKREILFIWNHSFGAPIMLRMHLRASTTLWNHSFGAQIRLKLHLRASRTLWLLGAPRPPAQWQCATARWPCIPRKGKKGKLFSQNRNTFHLESLILGTFHP